MKWRVLRWRVWQVKSHLTKTFHSTEDDYRSGSRNVSRQQQSFWRLLSPERSHKTNNLMKTLHLTLKMTTAQVVEMSVTNNSLSKDYSHPDDHKTNNWYSWVQTSSNTATKVHCSVCRWWQLFSKCLAKCAFVASQVDQLKSLKRTSIWTKLVMTKKKASSEDLKASR